MNLKKPFGVCVAWLTAAVLAQAQTWLSVDVGNVGVIGNASNPAAGALVVAGGGADISGTADACQFVYQTLTGDGQVTARVVSVPTTDGWAKAGLMIRDSLSANSKDTLLVATRGYGLQFSSRKTTGGSTSSKYGLANRYAPQWLRLIRTGTTVAAYASADNITWEYLASDTVSLATTVYVGVAVTSRNINLLGTASFDNVAVVPGTVSDVSSPQPPVLGVGERSNATIALGWKGATDDLGISSYVVQKNGATLATLPGTTCAFTDSGLAASTAYSYSVKAYDASGKVSQLSNVVNVTTDAASVGTLNASQDIGTVGVTGSTSFDSVASSYTMQGAGSDIAGTADAFRFGYQQCGGDKEIVVRVGAIQNGTSTSKAGVMIRESLSANAAEAAMLVTAGSAVTFQSRKTTGGATVIATAPGYQSLSSRTLPQWLKIVRCGNVFKGYVSADGVNWEYVGGDTIAMSSSAYVGLAVSSRNTGALCNAVFTGLDISSVVDTQNPNTPTGLSIYDVSDVSLTLTWPMASDNVAVDSYKVFQDGVWIGTTLRPRFMDVFQNPGTSHNYSVQAVDVVGNTSQLSDAISVTFKPAGLPAPWLHDDLGNIELLGSASLNEQVFGVTGSGDDIGNAQDSFHYAYQPLDGDKTIIARVASIPNPPNSSVKAAVMIRETLDAGSHYAMVYILSGGSASLQWRSATYPTCRNIAGDKTAKAPYWIKLVRSGSLFTGYQSADGVNWTFIGTCSVPMATAGYIGLAVTSRDVRNTASANFDNVLIITDSDGNGLPDSWELANFNQIGIDPNALAPRNDGLTNLQAYQQGLNPMDYYNGIAPKVVKVSGDAQNGAINTFLAKPLVMCVTSADGTPLVNAPVTVTVSQGGGLVASSITGTAAASLVFHSDVNGLVNVYYKEGGIVSVNSTIQMTAGKTSTSFTATGSPQVGYWTFNSNSGITTPDSSNTGNLANTIGGLTWSTGFDGTGAIALDGSTGYVEVPVSPTMALGAGPVSITAWVCLPQNLSLNDEAMIYPLVTLGDQNNEDLALCVRGGGHGLEARLNTTSGVVSIDVNQGATVMADGGWHQVGFISDGNGNASVVLDGAIVATQSGVQIQAVASPRMWLGRDNAGHYFAGGIDEVELRREVLTTSNLLAKYNADSNKDGMADWWEWKNFATLKVTASADPDGDGVTNIQEYQNGTSPNEYFNGITPTITKASGDSQNGMTNCYLAQGLTVLVSNTNGVPLANAPVTFTVQSGGGSIATTNTATTALTTLAGRTGADGRVTVYYKQGGGVGVGGQIKATAAQSSVMFTENSTPLVANWSFDEGTGSTVGDSSNTGSALTLNGGATWDSGYDGKSAVKLDGTSGYLSTACNPSLTMGTSSMLTVAAWVRLPSDLSLGGDSRVYPLITFGSATADALALVIRGSISGTDLLLTNASATLARASLDSAVIADGNWHHLGFVADGQGGLILVFDGRLLISKSGVTLPVSTSPRICLGRDAAGHFASASFDDALIRNDALTLVDFQNLYNIGLPDSGLPNWWKWARFGTLSVDPAAQSGNDGSTNLQKYQAEITPTINPSDNVPGQFKVERWNNINSYSVPDLIASGRIYNTADVTYLAAPGELDFVGEYFGTRSRGYIKPKSTGDYTFWLSARTSAQLWLSDDDQKGKYAKRLIAQMGSDLGSGHGIASNESNLWAQYAIQKSAKIHLQAGHSYYMEILHQHGHTSGSHVSIACALNDGPKEVLPSTVVSPYSITPDDLDDDFLPDAWEVLHGLNPNDRGQIDPAREGERGDFDGDGLSNREEYLLGTDPAIADTDGDSVNDGNEVHTYGTNPTHSDAPSETIVGSVNPSSYTSATSGWTMTSQGLMPSEFRGQIEWQFTVPRDGFWIIKIPTKLLGTHYPGESVDVGTSIDGASLGSKALEFGEGRDALIRVVTPRLTAGNHSLALMIDNIFARRMLSIVSIEIAEATGLDLDGNGVADWLTTELQKENQVTNIPTLSRVSPVCIEGFARTPSGVTINGVGVSKGTGDHHWFANLPLVEDCESSCAIEFEAGTTTTGAIAWEDTNVLNGETLDVRVGDTLKLRAVPSGGSTGELVTLTMPSSLGGNRTLTSDSLHCLCTFSSPGTFQIAANHPSGGSGVLTVNVKKASFSSVPVDLMLNDISMLSFLSANVDPDLTFDGGESISFDDHITWINGRTFAIYNVLIDSSSGGVILARLHKGGPILGSIPVNILTLSDALENDLTTSTLSADFPGYQVVQTPIVMTGMPPDGKIVVNISRAGVTFLDGTTVKTLQAQDFKDGIAVLEFLFPVGMTGGYCHNIAVYDRNGVCLGRR